MNTDTKTVFATGERVWRARCGTREVAHPCPVCFGKLSVILELGNGERIQTPCDYCGKGWDGPRGVIKECEWIGTPEYSAIESSTVRNENGKQSAEYHFYGGYYAHDYDVFSTKEEAEARCAVLIAEHAASEKQRAEWSKEYAHKNFAWHVGYHRREAKKARASAEYHEARAIACKARAKTPVEGETPIPV